MIQATLSLLKKVINVPSIKNLEVKYVHKVETKEFINEYFIEHQVEVKDTNVSVENLNNRRIYTNVYTIEIPKEYNIYELIEELSAHDNVRKIKLIDL